jgi:hypothetical protein
VRPRVNRLREVGEQWDVRIPDAPGGKDDAGSRLAAAYIVVVTCSRRFEPRGGYSKTSLTRVKKHCRKVKHAFEHGVTVFTSRTVTSF